DHDELAEWEADCAPARAEEWQRRLADRDGPRAGRFLQRGHERAAIELQPRGSSPEPVAVHRDQFRAVQNHPERAVHPLVGQALLGAADDDDVRARAVLVWREFDAGGLEFLGYVALRDQIATRAREVLAQIVNGRERS